MKQLITLIFLFTIGQFTAQEQYPKIQRVNVQDKLLKIEIGSYPATLYLSKGYYSNYNPMAYSVKGWYYYDHIKTKIPLVGLFDTSELTLYNFNDKSKIDDLLNFSSFKGSYSNEMDHYKNLNGYQEKFVFSKNGHEWTNPTKKLEVYTNVKDFSIGKTNQFLHLNSTTAFDLHSIGNHTWNFKILGHKEGKLILKYKHPSRMFPGGGMCGTGVERGFLELKFDKNHKLIQYTDYLYESCFKSINTTLRSSNNILTYSYKGYSNDPSFDLIVDLNKLSVKKIIK